MRKIAAITFWILLFFQFSSSAQSTATYKYHRDRSATKGKNRFVNELDTIKAPQNIVSTESIDRSIYWQGKTYTFKRNKSTKKNELLSEQGVVLAICEGSRSKFFNITDLDGHAYVLRNQGGKKWSYWVDQKKVLDGKFITNETEKRVDITLVDAAYPDVALASVMSFAYTSEIIRGRRNIPVIIGAAAFLVVIRAAVGNDSTPAPQ